MIDLMKCSVERLKADDAFILYRAQPEDGKHPLLALVPRQPTIRSLDKLKIEHALTAHLDPTCVLRPLELVPHKDHMMLVMEDPGGELLKSHITEPLDLDVQLSIAVALANTAGRLHRHGLVHRNINPENIFVSSQNSVRLIGFRHATRQTHRPISSDLVSAALPYIAPEQTGRMNRSIDCRSDLYAIGVTLYELFTGALPFSASTPEEWIHSHIVRVPPSLEGKNPNLPPQLSAIVLKLLSKDPADRYQSAEGLATDLNKCLSAWVAHREVPHFSLGKYDLVTSIRIPRALYGRKSESAALRAAFDRAAKNGQTSIAMISGRSGVGKSSLVAEFQSSLTPDGALIAAGKFDSQMRNVPYAALTQAFGSLIQQILTYDEKEVAAWRRRLIEAVGPNGHLVTELLPAFELLIGQQTPLADLRPEDRLYRLRIVFRRLTQAFARPSRPLVLFIDDLQWLDVASLELIRDLLARRDVPNFLFIGAYRTDKAESFNPLMSQLSAIRTEETPIKEIVLQPLRSSDINSLMAETLECDRAQIRPLADLVHQKTGGNPFFVMQFIKTLNDDGFLIHDRQTNAWQWDLSRVRTKTLTDNVADLMAAKLTLLPESTRQVLQVLAFLGSAAELEVLAIASGRSTQQVSSLMEPALQAGLITLRELAYAFVHDRVQEAAYELGQQPGAKAALHLRIGMTLAEHIDLEKTSDKLYAIANQLNLGVTAITSNAEREKIISVNLSAGRRARSAAAYNAAIFHLRVARELVGNEARLSWSPTAFAIALLNAECELLVGHLDVAEAQLMLLSQNCPDVQTGSEVARLRANLYTMRGQTERAIDVCLEFLRQVGIDWHPHPTDSQVDEEGHHLRKLAKKLSSDALQALPPMIDPQQRATMAVFADLITPALLTDLNLSNIVILAAARLTLQHGVCEESSYPLACVFSVFNIRYADGELGFRLSHFAVSLADRWPQSRWSGRTLLVFGQFVTPWIRPMRSGQPFIRRSLDIALAIGDLTWVGYSHHALVSARLFVGDALQEIYKDAVEVTAFAEASGFKLIGANLAVQKGFALSLMGSDEEGDHRGVLDLATPIALESTSPQVICFHQISRIQLHVIAGRYSVALKLASDTPFRSVRAYAELVEFRFYVALAHAGAHDICPLEQREFHASHLRQHYHELTIRCMRNQENFADRMTLIAAEIARLEGRELEAERLYEESIKLARISGFVQIEAIAAECAARFYEHRNIRTVFLSYLANARDCYLRWGARSKVREIERSNPHLSESDLVRGQPDSSDVQLYQLDVNALFKASRALSGEIELNALIRTLMQVVVEHAAAQRGILFLMRGGAPQAVAKAHLGDSGIDVIAREADCRNLEFSRSALNYVVRTRTSLSSVDAASDSLFSTDPYMQKGYDISLHCLPIIAQTKLVGVLYLESQVAVGAFSPQRKAVLDLLAAQAAISLENARLYADLQRHEAFLAEGQSISHTGSWSFDANTGNLIWSIEHYRIFGMDPEAAQAPTVARIFRMIHPQDRTAVRRAVETSLRNRTPFSCEYRLLRSDGLRYLHVVGRPSRDMHERIENYVGTTVDLTDHRKAQEALQAAQSELARVSRLTAIGELTGLIAHEVRQPLTAISARAGACRSWLGHVPPDMDKANSAIALIEQYAHRASGVIESIRQMTRKATPTRASIDINDLINETATLLNSEIHRQRVLLKIDLGVGLRPVCGDRIQLQQVIMNLMINGIEAMAGTDHQPRLLRLSTESNSSNTVLVTVTDNGPGLPLSNKSDLFEAFFTTKPNGLGVGLTICRSIVETHGGQLWVNENTTSGATFKFTVPTEDL
jgi:PAS domain S-box-containing protein